MHTDNTPALYVKIENRPGALDHVAKVLREKRINVDAISLETVGSTGFVRIVTPKLREAVDALRHERIEAYDTNFVSVKPDNRPGELHKLTSELAAAGLNVEAILTTADGRLAIRTNDNETASRILGKL